MKLSLVAVSAVACFTLACGSADDNGGPGSEENDLTSAPEASPAVIVFDADFGESLEGELVAGDVVTIDYDPARLEQCAATQGGNLQWAITGHHLQADGEVRMFDVISPNNPSGEPAELELEEPGTLELWFEATSVFGCHEWDSDFGANYAFEIGE